MFESTIGEAISFVFYPLLTSPKHQLKTPQSPYEMDIVYYISANSGTLHDLKMTSGCLRLVVEVKNAEVLRSAYFQQLDAYLGTPVGCCGFLVFRGCMRESYSQHVSSLWSKGKPTFLFTEDELRSLALRRIECKKRGMEFLPELDQVLAEKSMYGTARN